MTLQLNWDQTDEERKLRVDAILERNSKPVPKCISCKQPITAEQPILPTIHGPYHGEPFTCVEGRD